MSAAVSLTPAAAEHVRGQIDARGHGVGVRLGVKTSGCSGLSYVLEFVDEVQPEDTVFNTHGVQLVVDEKSLLYLDGTELDLVREGLNTGLKFNNPNAKASCSCGESFAV